MCSWEGGSPEFASPGSTSRLVPKWDHSRYYYYYYYYYYYLGTWTIGRYWIPNFIDIANGRLEALKQISVVTCPKLLYIKECVHIVLFLGYQF